MLLRFLLRPLHRRPRVGEKCSIFFLLFDVSQYSGFLFFFELQWFRKFRSLSDERNKRKSGKRKFIGVMDTGSFFFLRTFLFYFPFCAKLIKWKWFKLIKHTATAAAAVDFERCFRCLLLLFHHSPIRVKRARSSFPKRMRKLRHKQGTSKL